MKRMTCLAVVLVLALAGGLWGVAPAEPVAQLKILLPLNRKAYQTNEAIDVSVVRTAPAALPASDLIVNLTGEDGSRLRFNFPAGALVVHGKEARGTEHLHLNGALLRPGNYTLEASAHGATARTEIEVHSHIHQSTFRLGDWGSRAKGAEQAVLGEHSLGFNLLYAMYGGLSADDTIRGGLDYMWGCTMSGGHQMDLRMECDWSDPYVTRGGTARVVRRAFMDRINPNAIGVHFYDEPGLTWQKHPATGEMTPHNIPAQERSYRSAFGREPLQYHLVKADDPGDAARWREGGLWKLGFLDAAWKLAAFGVHSVRPDFLPVTQSVYGWSAYADGYYFNVVRSLPVISGHGGYDDVGGGYFAPSFHFEFGRMRDLQKPSWYLPAWYHGMPSDRFRLEQYLSFMNNLQGMMKPPDHTIHRPSTTLPTADGIVESNKLMARLGTIFTTMPVTRPPVAVLYSMSQNLHAQTKDMKDNYLGGHHAREKTLIAYLAGKLAHQPLFPIVEEDVVDGTLAAYHKAVLLPGVNYLDAKVVSGLEAFAAAGGAVLLSDDSEVRIRGAVKLGCPVDITLLDRINTLWQQQKIEERQRIDTVGNFLKAAEPLARALTLQCRKLGIAPVLGCDNPEIVASRQAQGDIEYFFAVNAAYDSGVGGQNSLKPATANIELPLGRHWAYDAILGGPVSEFVTVDQRLSGRFRFGPGQMRVFACTARPIGSVQALTPTLFRDYTVEQEPLRVEVGAVLTDDKGRVLFGSAPLRVRLIDPLGVTRYDLYRATDRGCLKLNLPLAVNDPAGEWKVVVRDLLANTEDTARFTYQPPKQCGALAGATGRAVSFGNDRNNIFRFFRTHQDVTIVKGRSDYNATAAERLAEVLKPWNVDCKIVNADDVNHPRPITPEEAKTWCGLEPGRVRPGPLNDRTQVGFAVRGPVILLGAPEDNPLIQFTQKAHFLPYQPDAHDFPGTGRGFLAWQRDAVGYEQESITLIAYDAAGMAEAVGSLYEAAAGLDPLTRWVPPASNSVTAANKAPVQAPEAAVAWKVTLPDRAVGVKALRGGHTLILAEDGSLAAVDATGKIIWASTIVGGERWALAAAADGSVIAVGASQHLAGFGGDGQSLFDVPLSADKPASVVTFVAVAPEGSHVAAGCEDGTLTLLQRDGKRLWTVGGVPAGNKKARPNPYLSAIFTGDGRALVALTANEVQVVSLTDGKVEHRDGGATGRVAPLLAGQDVVLNYGMNVTWFNPTSGKVVKTINLPNVGVVSLALSGSGVVVGTEADGAVRQLPSSGGGVKVQPVWEHKAAQRLVKKVAGGPGLTAVAYWGGLVEILDEHGAVKSARVFPQDVAALDWAGNQLVVGLANGQVFGLPMKPPL